METKICRYLILIFILCFWCSDVSGYKLKKTSTGKVIKWNTSIVKYYVNKSRGPSSGSRTAVNNAMKTWTKVSSANFNFVYGGDTSSKSHGRYDGKNIVTFGSGLSSNVLAVNQYWYSTSTGYILDSDIKFNTVDFTWSTSGSASSYDVQNIATHEFGHSLHLADLYSSADSQKTMYGYGSRGETKKRTLTSDDIRGISYLYPQSDKQYASPDLYSWNSEGYVNNGHIFFMSYCPEQESYQERLVTDPVRALNNEILTFKIKEEDDVMSHINSFSMYYRSGGNDWKELDLISAVHNKAGDVRKEIKKKDNNRAYLAPGDEILLTYRIPDGGVENVEFKSISSGYYLLSAETWCQILDLGPALDVQPGATVTLQARINNMSAYELPAGARIYFNIQGSGYSNNDIVFSLSAESLAPGNPKWYSFHWTVPNDVQAGEYNYSASVYVGGKNITWGVQLPTVSENRQDGGASVLLTTD